jgi:hypothetical protein
VRVFGENWLKVSVAGKLKLAATAGTFGGVMNSWGAAYLESCKALHRSTGSLLIFTRDTGHHTSGWFKNPQFERCLHLSLSFREPSDWRQPRDFDKALAAEWCEIFFADDRRYIWAESPKTPDGKVLQVNHYRVFTDEYWQPMIPRGEVYSTELTEKGWKSWSELHPEDGRKEPSILHAG